MERARAVCVDFITHTPPLLSYPSPLLSVGKMSADCAICDKTLGPRAAKGKCHLCNKNYHLSCADISQEAYTKLKLKLPCGKCHDRLECLMSDFDDFKLRLEALEKSRASAPAAPLAANSSRSGAKRSDISKEVAEALQKEKHA